MMETKIVHVLPKVPDLINYLHDVKRWEYVDLARYLEVTPTTLYRWRTGKSPVTMPRLVARALQDLVEQP